MTISRITKTRQGRYALFDENDVFLFSVDDETLVKNHVKEDMELTSVQLAGLKAKSDTRKAKDKALGYLSLRDYASCELYEKLCLKYDAQTAAQAVAEMHRLDMLNDEAFALHRAKYLVQQKKSEREIRQHLLQKGIARDTIDTVLLQLAPNDEDAAVRLIQKSYLRKLQNGEKDKVLAALARHGFGYSDAKQAIATCMQAIENEETEDYE